MQGIHRTAKELREQTALLCLREPFESVRPAAVWRSHAGRLSACSCGLFLPRRLKGHPTIDLQAELP